MTLWANLALAVGSAAVLVGGAWLTWSDLEGRQRGILLAATVAAFPVAVLGSILLARDVMALTGPLVEAQALVVVGLTVGLLSVLGVGATIHPWDRHPWIIGVPFAVLAAIVFLPVWVSTAGVGVALGGTLMTVALLGAQGLPRIVGRASTLPRKAGEAGAATAHAVAAGAAIVALLFAFNYSGAVDGTEFAWSARVVPSGGDTVEVRVPFLAVTTEAPVPVDPAAAPMLDLLRDRIAVTDGDAASKLQEEGRAVEITGNGPVTVRADLTTFWGSRGSEAFLDWTIPTRNVTNLGGDNATVTWRLSASGGLCGISGEARAEVPADESAPLASTDPDEERILQAVCI